MASLRLVLGRSTSLLTARCVSLRIAKMSSSAGRIESTAAVVTHTGQVLAPAVNSGIAFSPSLPVQESEGAIDAAMASPAAVKK